MKASKFSDAQKAFILKQGNDGVPVAEICRKAGISQATYFNWKKKYAGLMPRAFQGSRSAVPFASEQHRCLSANAKARTGSSAQSGHRDRRYLAPRRPMSARPVPPMLEPPEASTTKPDQKPFTN